MSDSDKELEALGAEPHDDELKALGGISHEDQSVIAKHMARPEVSKTQSAAEGLASGGTFGFSPRIGAAGGALASSAQQKLSGEPNPQALKDLYNEYLKANNERQAAAHAANPKTFNAAMFAGALASPLNKIGAIGAAGEGASIPMQMAQGTIGGAAMGATAGASQSPDLTNLPQTAKSAAMGVPLGIAGGAMAPPLNAALKASASSAANFIRPLIGKPGELAQKGLEAGMESAPNLAGEPGQLQATDSRGEFANQFVQDLHNILSGSAKNKRELIAQALDKSQLAPADAVNAVTQKYLEMNPQLNEESSRKELAQLKDMIITAKEGPLKTETVRHYTPGDMEPSVANEPIGHKKIMSREIDPEAFLDVDAENAQPDEILEPKTQKDEFEADVEKKKAEIRALPGHPVDPDTIETHYEPIKDSDKVMAVARAPIYAENPEAFKGQPAGFQDIEQTVREGDRNLQNPEELYNLQKQLENKSQFSEGRGFSSQDMNKLAGNAAKDIAQLIKMTIPETVPVDERLNAFNNVAERLGINTDKLKLPGGEGEKARADAMKKVLGVLNPESPTDKSGLDQKAIDYIQQQLNRTHPDIGNAFAEEASKHAENAQTMKDLNQPQTVGGGGPILSSMRRGIGKAAYNTGYSAGNQINKIKSEVAPALQKGQQLFQAYTPEALQKAGAAAASSGNEAVQKLGQVLTKLSSTDDRTRNSMMFVLQQQAGYRQLMAPYFEKQEPGTPQAKDKTLEKYK